MLDINVSIPKDTVRDFEQSFTRFQTVLGNGMGTAVRRGFSALCRSLIARTKVAPKLVPTSSVNRHDHNALGGPSYITPKGHHQKPVPRWRITRREGSGDVYGYSVAAKSAAEARRKYGKIKNAGLAKKSWSIVRGLIAMRNGKVRAGMAKSGDVRGYVREIGKGANPRVEALIENNLKYIAAATPDAAVSEAMAAATQTINHIVNDKLNEAIRQI